MIMYYYGRCPNITVLSIQNIDISSVEMYNFMHKYTSLKEVYVDVWIADTMYRLFHLFVFNIFNP